MTVMLNAFQCMVAMVGALVAVVIISATPENPAGWPVFALCALLVIEGAIWRAGEAIK